MTYYESIAEDLKRAKEILERGKVGIDGEDAVFLSPALQERMKQVTGGTIYGADIYAAYKLLESFVMEIERLHLEMFINRSDVLLAHTAKEACHACGIPWTDPVTGIEYPVEK